MKTPITTFLLSSGAISAAATLRHANRQASQGCCFQLDSSGTLNEDVEEDHTGHLDLGGTFQQGSFCLDGGKVQDAVGNQCFMRSPNYQFQCYQKGVVGDTVFDIVSADNGTTKLVYNDGPGTYLACSSDGGESYEIYSTAKPDTTGCIEVSLVLSEQNGACFASNSTLETGANDACVDDVVAREAKRVQLDVEPPTTCSVSTSAPSLAPVKVGSPDKDATDGTHDTGVNASVTSTDSTIFHYAIPKDFANSTKQLCALEFRLPICSNLPSGYPCFKFTGSEQESLSNSGMVFSQFGDDDELPGWNSTSLQQIYPGDKKVLGTFPCGAPKYGSGTRAVAWSASSVRDFGLEFEQAGVGPSKFKDGVGAFIVQCL
ncbi:hypothetical protein SUNI508_12096 [Seiridium unicorne]|uniref:Ubiquitin 3 binding protein But2 C-terminal domain-containing protein n=1 Tax=Seiridium unicorne TaxID=138068 RepID=A0ABR2UFH9_9PEZI